MEVRETFNLRWDWFEANTRATLMELREEAEFHDITLVVSDGNQVKANKMVLAGGSKFFHKILRENPHPHPLIYLKDVAHKHLLSVMDYLYTGQANIQEEDIKKFLETAEDLKIKGLVPPDEQTNSLPETIAPLLNQPSAQEYDREKRKVYSPNANPTTHQSHPSAQEHVASNSVSSKSHVTTEEFAREKRKTYSPHMIPATHHSHPAAQEQVVSQSHVSTEELAREKRKTYHPNMIPATQKGQVDIQVSSKCELLSQSPMLAEKHLQSKHETWETVSSFQCQASAKEHAQEKTISSHRATPALQGQTSTDVVTSKSREQLPHTVPTPQIGNSFQNSNTCKVKVEVPVGDANDYNVHYEINDQGQHYISRFSERAVTNNEKKMKYLSEQNEAMEQDHDDQITTMVPKEEPIDSNSTTFHTKVYCRVLGVRPQIAKCENHRQEVRRNSV